MMNMKSLMLLAIVTVIAVSCAKVFSRSSSRSNQALTAYSTVNVDEFQALIADPNVQLLDVRTRDEYDEGHIAGAKLVDVNESNFV